MIDETAHCLVSTSCTAFLPRLLSLCLQPCTAAAACRKVQLIHAMHVVMFTWHCPNITSSLYEIAHFRLSSEWSGMGPFEGWANMQMHGTCYFGGSQTANTELANIVLLVI